jgi:sarcosine oxidase, subunit beta
VKTVDVAIIGGGILGLSSGYWLAKQGLRVTVLEKGRIAWEASGRATGFQSLRGENPPEIALAAEANRLWLTLDEELGYPTEWLAGGRLWVELGDPEFQDLRNTCSLWQAAGLPVRLVDSAEARTLAPCLSERVLGGMHTSRGGHANPQRATQAFAWALQDRGGNIVEHTPVLGITSANGKVTGVETPDGTISAGFVVNCAGPQIAMLSRPLGIEVPIVAARLEACVTTPLPQQFDVAMVGNGLSIRQTRRGNIHFNGGPHEWVAVDLTGEPAKPNTPVARGAARRLAELFPALANTALLRTWAGVVEVTPDHATIIERASAPDGLILVTASGHGFGLAPAIGKSICELVVKGRSSVPIDGLSLGRFAGLAPDWAHSRRWTAGAYNT